MQTMICPYQTLINGILCTFKNPKAIQFYSLVNLATCIFVMRLAHSTEHICIYYACNGYKLMQNNI